MPPRAREVGTGAILVTGGTGFLGSQLLAEIAAWKRPLWVLARKGSEERLEAVRARAEAAVPGAARLIEAVPGDLTEPDLGLSAEARQRLLREVDEIFHIGGLVDGDASREALVSVNLEGTDRVLDLARQVRSLHRLHFVSCSEVAGDYAHIFHEDQLFVNQRFASDRALSKFRAEAAVRKNAPLLPITIYRPGPLVGHSVTGEMPRVDGPYLLLETLRRLRSVSSALPVFGPGGDHFVQMVPVDYVVRAIAAIAQRERRRGSTFTLTDPRPLTYFEFVGLACGRLGLRRPRFGVPLQPLRRALTFPLAASMLGRLLRTAGMPSAVLGYIQAGALHETSNTEAILRGTGISCPRVADYFDRIFEYYLRYLVN
jgi:thioester reductase-like protein